MQTIRSLSITQLREYANSPRRWALKYLENLPEPPSVHTDFGLKIHKWLEDYHNSLLTPPGGGADGDLDTENLEFLCRWAEKNPQYKAEKYNTETDFKIWLDPELPPFKGIIDLYKIYLHPQPFIHIVDHKTANRRYAKTADELKTDWQLSLYLYAIRQCLPHVPHAPPDALAGKITLNYFEKRANLNVFSKDSFLLKKNWKVEANLLIGDLNQNITEIKETAFRLMADVIKYKEQGLGSLDLGESKAYRFGAPDPYWACLTGEMSPSDYKKLWLSDGIWKS